MKIEYSVTDEKEIDVVSELWQKLYEYHRLRSRYFSEHYPPITFEMRKSDLLKKSEKGALRIDLATDMVSNELVGYCISTVSEDGQGEIESIFIESDYRYSGIGDKLMSSALGWMDEHSVTKKIIGVGDGNEEVFAFYSRYGFYPRTTILMQVEVE